MAAAAVRISAGKRPWEYQPLRTQRQFHLDLRTRFKGFSGPVGSGKSHALAYEAIFLAQLNPGRKGLVGAPTYSMLRDTTQRTILEVLETEGLGFALHKAENRLTLQECGSDMLFRSLDNPERLRGPNLAWVAVDELTYCAQQAWLRLEARIRDPKGNRLCGCAVWTPKGFDWVYQKFIGEPKPNYRAYLAMPRENRHLASDYYDNLAASYDERFYRQEALGEYLNVQSGQAYYAFDRDQNVRPLGYISDDTLCWALDFNISPMSSLIVQIQASGQDYYRTGAARSVVNVLDEIALMDSSVWKACQAFEEKTKDWARRAGTLNVRIYGDATGGNREHATGASCYQMIKEYFQKRPEYRLSWHTRSQNPPVRNRVNAMNAKLCSSDGTRTLFLDPRCKQLKRDLEQVTWKLDANKAMTGELDQKDGLTHISDALGYLIEAEFGLHAKGGPRSGYVA